MKNKWAFLFIAIAAIAAGIVAYLFAGREEQPWRGLRADAAIEIRKLSIYSQNRDYLDKTLNRAHHTVKSQWPSGWEPVRSAYLPLVFDQMRRDAEADKRSDIAKALLEATPIPITLQRPPGPQ